MIASNELRRGNKISYYRPLHDNPVIDTVIGILPVEEYGSVDCAYLENYSPINIDALIPIPLTPEILKRCGFENYQYAVDVFNAVYIGSYVDGYCLTNEHGTKVGKVPIAFLHQLQNLYFALTAEELNVQL